MDLFEIPRGQGFRAPTLSAIGAAIITIALAGGCAPNGAKENSAQQAASIETQPGLDPACFQQGNLSCTHKPGLGQGQKFQLSASLVIPQSQPVNQWLYFTEGKQVTAQSMENGQKFCGVTNTSGKLPNELVRDGVGTVPVLSLTLTEISWYVGTVFFEGQLPDGATVGIVVYCGSVSSGDLSDGETSLHSIQKHLAGILTELK